MYIGEDISNLEVVKERIPSQEFLHKSSVAYTSYLLNHDLIRLDSSGKVRFTDKGKIAKKIGIKKYLELEKLEKKFLDYNCEELKWRNVFLCLLLVSVTFFLIYLNVIL